MRVVIDIDDRVYEMVMNTGTFGIYRFNTVKAIQNGTPLPKGHGRLVDADAILVEPFGNTYRDIDTAETIIEADMESEE